MIVWGGSTDLGDTNTGGEFDPSTNSWEATSISGAPSPRWSHTAVWTGSQIVVWGGKGNSEGLNDGASYDPSLGTWLPHPAVGAPAPTILHGAAWTGSHMLIYGGYDQGAFRNNLTILDPARNTWFTGTPSLFPRERPLLAWAAGRLIAWGGNPSPPNGEVWNPFGAPPPLHTLTVTKAGAGTGVISSSPPGINCGSDCEQTLSLGTLVTLYATGDSGAIFGGWGVACSAGGASWCTFSLTGDVTVSVSFNPPPPSAQAIYLDPLSPGTTHEGDRAFVLKHSLVRPRW